MPGNSIEHSPVSNNFPKLFPYLVEERIGNAQNDGWEGGAVAGGHFLEVNVVDCIEGPVISNVPTITKKFNGQV